MISDAKSANNGLGIVLAAENRDGEAPTGPFLGEKQHQEVAPVERIEIQSGYSIHRREVPEILKPQRAPRAQESGIP